ncbi:hypothetical protein LXL04_032854 [Taraxacum kok-saghyz]
MTPPARRLEGKVALITGAARGIGECCAKLFAEHGAKVVVADVEDQLGQAVCESIGSSNSIYVHCDISNEDDVKNAIDTAVATYGKLDIMFNNAGVADVSKPRIMDIEKKDVERVLGINVIGTFLCMKHAARVMVPQKSGSIISTSSLTSHLGGMATHAYSCSKHAIVGLTRNLAVELGQFGIRVNCVSPFGIATSMTADFIGLEREVFENVINSVANLKGVTHKPDDVAYAALYLASDEAKYVSGQNMLVDGGLSYANDSFKMFKYPEEA